MHPQIVREHPGSCPICGMDLVEKAIKPAQATPVVKLSDGTVQKLGVRSAAVTRGKLWKYIKTVGRVRYDEHRLTTVYSTTDGWVENLSARVLPGRYVTRGQLLMEIYSPEFLAAQKAFIAAQKNDQSGHLKKYEAQEERVPSLDHLRYLEMPESMMKEVARNGKPHLRLPVYAPHRGTIVRQAVHKQMFVSAGQPMISIADLSTVWVETDVFEHQLAWVERDQQAEITVDAYPGHRFSGRVTYLYPELDPGNHSLKVRLQIDNPNHFLKPEMFAHANIYGGPKAGVLKIPREALIVTGEREAVIRDLGGGRFKPVDVVTGMHTPDEVEILSGLEEGDQVVVSGQFMIDSEANLQASFQRLEAPHE